MDLIIDIGNSNIVLSIYKNDSWTNAFRYETKDDRPQFFYEKGLAEILFEWGVHSGNIKQVVISSVVPAMNQKIIDTVRRVINIEPILLSSDIFKELNFHIPLPNEIGSDLVANAYAASKLYDKSCIIVDFGTALTFVVVDQFKGIQGVTIAPGIKTAFHSLYTNTALLPEVNFHKPTSVIGKNTSEAIQAGIVFGYEGLVKHILEKIKQELGEEYYVVATGGLAEVMNDLSGLFDVINKNLTLEGIRLIGNTIK
jgi:type III pantothenate kinase